MISLLMRRPNVLTLIEITFALSNISVTEMLTIPEIHSMTIPMTFE